ncbi:alpha-hydroxyketone-type quorum-sensing autoinducer synthase [Legionella fallonii]|uniref:8-amino-7-oxononanoate synthase n=1 Tax=Legionella fallonii LLAP-10 TaxID=1212491 RepID=A0A098G2T5_9GAMM|nr:alpha-hydroxyketone-type quorum-sensing autoinducer synthase [Legionella fallonii]CEG55800.1 8-amino-7-oxononanoate synthase [Legionella fallonii LLAP-10]
MVIQNNNNAKDSLFENPISTLKVEHYPNFINKALEQYFEERIKKTWHGEHILQGKTPTSESLVFSSNDYLNISKHPLLIESQIAAMQEFGNGQMQSVVFLNNHSVLFEKCERQFSQFLKLPSSVLTQSGWCANMGLIQSLAQPRVPVYLDFYTHMSFWSGVKAAGAQAVPFQHNSLNSLQKKLERHGSGIIAVDSVYSTLGTVSPIQEYVALAQEYNCLLIVDESHSLGTHGPNGSGLVAQLGLSEQVDIITASLAKAFSGRGGLIAGKKELVELVRYSSLPSIFSSAIQPHDLAGFSSSLHIIANEEWRRKQLHDNANYLRNTLLDQGFDLCNSASQIIPIMAGTEENIIWLRDKLEQEDVFGAVFCSPATPKNKTLIRLSISANHTQSDLDRVIDCLARLAKQYPEYLFLKKE